MKKIEEKEWEREYLIENYHKNKKSLKELLSKLGYSHHVLYQRLKQYNIPIKPKYIDLTGRKINGWKVISIDKSYRNYTRWLCECDCGCNQRVVKSSTRLFKGEICKLRWAESRTLKEEIRNTIWNRIIYLAKIRDLEFAISKEYAYEIFLKQNKKCALTGIDIRFAKNIKEHKHGCTNASLDRIDSDKGYVPGNIHWVHKDINRMKWDFNIDYFKEMCKRVAEYDKQNN